MSNKKALITGIRGQDGAYLSKLLLEKGYEVYGADRRSGDSLYWRLNELNIQDDVKLVNMDLLDKWNIHRILSKIKPDEIYNLAAQSFVGTSFEQPLLTTQVNALGVLELLDTIRSLKMDTKFYQASTSEMFGKVKEIPQNEDTHFHPRSPYGIAKLYGHWITINFREAYNIFTCCGILFNHESPLRGIQFVTRKITDAFARIKLGMLDKIYLGNLEAKRDWGYAKEYVEGMWRMLQHDTPGDYVLATGQTHSIKDFVSVAADYAGLAIEWEGEGVDEKGIDTNTNKTVIEVSPQFFRPSEVDILRGNAEKAKSILGWEPKIKFDNLVEIMFEADIRRLEKQY